MALSSFPASRLAFAALSVLAACCYAACTYPDASFEPEATTSGAGGGGGAGLGGPGPGPSTTTAMTTTGPCTDADGDGVCVESGDCNDADMNVRPGQTAFFTEPREDGTFDYDCNGANDKEFPKPCIATGACPGPNGFLLDTPCGATGNFGACGTTGLLPICTISGLKSRKQACH